MRTPNFIIFIFLVTFFSCNNSTNKISNKTSIDTTRVEANSQTVNANSGQSSDKANSLQSSDCMRGMPEPIIIKKVYPNTTFKLLKDSLTAFETVDFDNGDKLVIKNWGCESYCLTFRFETNRFQDDATNSKYWFKKAIQLMEETEKGFDASAVEIDDGIKSLTKYLEKTNDPKFGEQISYGDNGFGNNLTIDKVQKLTDNKFAVELTFVVGL